MNENQNEMTSEQLDEAISYFRKFCASGQRTNQVIKQVESLARQGLQLREVDAEADDFAEKLNKYVRKGEHGIFETLDNLTTELEALRKVFKAACALDVRLKVIHASPHYLSVWQSYQNHGGDYSNGPKYDTELADLRTAIDSATKETK